MRANTATRSPTQGQVAGSRRCRRRALRVSLAGTCSSRSRRALGSAVASCPVWASNRSQAVRSAAGKCEPSQVKYRRALRRAAL
jgi:hypothetical protein